MSLFLNLENDIKNLHTKKINNLDSLDNDLKKSIQLYNNAIDMIKINCFTSCIKLLESSNSLNNKDIEIMNALGLVNLLFGKFDKACENFYYSNENNPNILARKYIEIMIGQEFKEFLQYYNSGIIKINEGNYNEAIEVFLNISCKENTLIEPYIILYNLYSEVKNHSKKNEYIKLIEIIDTDNEILFESINKNESNEDKNKRNNNRNKINLIVVFIVILISNCYFYNKYNKSDNIKLSISKLENNEINKDEIKQSTNKKANENKEELKNPYLSSLSEDELIEKAKRLKNNKNYKEAINVYKAIIKLNKNTNIVSESIYQIAILNESIKNNDEAIQYYKKYIENYSSSYSYYDESYYNLSMIYYNNNDIEKCKKYLSELVIKNPETIYNNSKIKEILEN